MGLSGRDGPDGRDGFPGVAGRDGVDGYDGEEGEEGDAGFEGRNGRDGRDAIAGGGGGGGTGPVLNFDFSDKFPQNGKVVVSSKTKSTTTIEFDGDNNGNGTHGGDHEVECNRRCDDDEVCRIVHGQPRCVPRPEAPSCEGVICDVPAEVCQLVPRDGSEDYLEPRCVCPDEVQYRTCPVPTCDNSHGQSTCGYAEKCVVHSTAVCGECPTASCEPK